MRRGKGLLLVALLFFVAMAACQPQIVEVEVTREVEKIVIATPAPTSTLTVPMFSLTVTQEGLPPEKWKGLALGVKTDRGEDYFFPLRWALKGPLLFDSRAVEVVLCICPDCPEKQASLESVTMEVGEKDTIVHLKLKEGRNPTVVY